MEQNTQIDVDSLASSIRSFRYLKDVEGQVDTVRLCTRALKGEIPSLIQCLVLMDHPIARTYRDALEDRRRAIKSLETVIKGNTNCIITGAQSVVRLNDEVYAQYAKLAYLSSEFWHSVE